MLINALNLVKISFVAAQSDKKRKTSADETYTLVGAYLIGYR